MADNPFVRTSEFVKSGTRPEHYPEPELPEIAVAGRSNVGKSSLINRMVNRRRLAKVSNTPGRTQLLNFFVINGEFMLCDLPGYGYAKVPRSVQVGWGAMIERYLVGRSSLRALLVLVDCRREPGEWERELVAFCLRHGRAVIPVATKVDKLPVSQRKPALARLSQQLGLGRRGLIGWSAATGEGLEPLWQAIQRHIAPLSPAELAADPEAAAEAAPAPAPVLLDEAGRRQVGTDLPPSPPPAPAPTRTRRFTIARAADGGLRALEGADPKPTT